VPKLRLSSSVFASVVALASITAASCGGSSNSPAATGGADAGSTGGVGTGGAGTGGKGTGGASTGGSSTGGSGTGGSSTGGAGTGGAGGAGGASLCGDATPCTIDALRCAAGVPQKCVADTNGCTGWVNQTVCGTHQTCGASGACECAAEPRCGAPGAEGNFCPTVGGAAFSVCTKDANGCFFVSAENQACTAPLTCVSTGVVTAGTACGCAANGTTLNSGCANVVINNTIASASDNAVLRCEMVNACKLWRILVNCADQSLTAGTDTTTLQPACVCKAAGSAPGATNALYVDPSPPGITVSNPPTGVIQPPACRLRSIVGTDGAIAKLGTTFTRIVAIHESSVSVTFPSVPANPLNIPANVTVTTADGPTFNPSHYTLNLGAGPVTLASGSNLSGFTLLGAPPASDILSCSTGTASANNLAIVGSDITQVGVAVRGNCALTASSLTVSGGGTGVNVTGATGAASLTGSSIAVTGVTANGLVIGNASSSATITGASSFAATGPTSTGIIIVGGTGSLTSTTISSGGIGVSLTGGGATLASSQVTSGGTGLSLTGGTASLTASPIIAVGTGISINGGSATLVAASNVTVSATGAATGVTLTGGSASLTASSLTVNGANGTRGIVNTGGQVTLATTGITLNGAIDGTARGIIQSGTTPTLTVTGGSITVPAATTAAVGVDIASGTATLTGVTETTGLNVSGIQAQHPSVLTVNGASVLTGSGLAATSTGIVIPASPIVTPTAAQLAVVTVGGTTQISGFKDGISSGDGSLSVSGTVQVTNNVRYGIALGGLRPATTTPNTQTTITGATVSGNGSDGIFVAASVPTTITGTTISGNKASGLNVAESQSTGTTGAKFSLASSTVTLNGTAATPAGSGVLISGAAGKVSAILQGNQITKNVLEGVRVLGGAALTEVAFNGNHISGNLTAVAPPVGTTAGGVSFVSGPIRLGQFVGNRVFGNGGNQIGFSVAQDISLMNPLAWDLSSGASGVDMATTCSDQANPNYVYCYGGVNSMPGTLGVGVSDPSIQVKVKGMHWAVAMPTATADFSNSIPVPTVLSPEPLAGVFQSCSPAAPATACADIP